MHQKAPRPGTALIVRTNRAGSEYLGGSSDPQSSDHNTQHQDMAAPACRFRLGQVQVRDHGAEPVVGAICKALLATSGPRAFECPKTSAAFHEAGHCVVGTLQGSIPSKATIWPVVELGRPQWIGRTYGLPNWRVDEKHIAEADLKHARSQLAGVVSEVLFDPDYRHGSSLDEIVTAQGIVLSAARKLRRDPEQLWIETLTEVARQLKTNELALRQVADVLMRRGRVKSRQLQQLLQLLNNVDD